MKTTLFCLIAGIVTMVGGRDVSASEREIPNRKIDYPAYQKLVADVGPLREKRRITEAEFIAMAAEPGTIVLDARSADKYALRHIAGAVSLPFTDFTEESLAAAIPDKATRVLIYCNNNFEGPEAERAFPAKLKSASLNISTFVALVTYGYKNVYELGPLLDVATAKVAFAGTEVAR